MTSIFFSLIGGFTAIVIFIFLLCQFILNERQIHLLKYTLYVAFVMLLAVLTIPLFLIRPRNAINIQLAARIMNPVFNLFGIKYRIENGQVFDNDKPCVIVANHQSSIDFIGMMQLWPEHVRYCTILAKKELFWALPFGFTAWLAGLEYVDRNSREQSAKTMRQLTMKIQEESLRLWVFPEGTRNMNGSLLPFKFGAFRTAIEAQIPIVPVVFSCYESIYNADKEKNAYYWRRGSVIVQCLEPIDTKGMTIENNLQELTDKTRQCMINAFEAMKSNDDKKSS